MKIEQRLAGPGQGGQGEKEDDDNSAEDLDRF